MSSAAGPYQFDPAAWWLNPATGQLHDRQTGQPRFQVHESGWLLDLVNRIVVNPAMGWAVDPGHGIALNMHTGERFNIHTGESIDAPAPAPFNTPSAPAPVTTAPPAPAATPAPTPPATGPMRAPAASLPAGGTCPVPAGWPWETAPLPQAALEIHTATSRQELLSRLASSPAAMKAQQPDVARQAVVGILAEATGLIPVVGGFLKGIAAALINGIIGAFSREPCVDPQKKCEGETFRADGRTAGDGGRCCLPRFAGLGVVASACVLGKGRPIWREGVAVAIPLPPGTKHDHGDTIKANQLGLSLAIRDDTRVPTADAGGKLSPDSFGPLSISKDTLVAVAWDRARDEPIPWRKEWRGDLKLRNADPDSLAKMLEEQAGTMRPAFRVWKWKKLRDKLREGALRIPPIVRYEMVDRWPGEWEELAAGDYPDIASGKVQPDELLPALSLAPGEVNQLLIPAGWSVTVYEHPGYAGESLRLDAGTHDLFALWSRPHGLRPVGSMRIRGWWTLADSRQAAALRDRAPGWLTEGWPDEPTRETGIALVLQDPCRPPAPASVEVPVPSERPSFWSAGWQERLQAMRGSSQPAAAAAPAPSRPAYPYEGRTVIYT